MKLGFLFAHWPVRLRSAAYLRMHASVLDKQTEKPRLTKHQRGAKRIKQWKQTAELSL